MLQLNWRHRGRTRICTKVEVANDLFEREGVFEHILFDITEGVEFKLERVVRPACKFQKLETGDHMMNSCQGGGGAKFREVETSDDGIS